MPTSFANAQQQLDLIEHAISAGDLVAAGEAVAVLRPLLVSSHTDELLALKARIDNMKFSVVAQRAAHKSQLKKLVAKQHASDRYQEVANR